MHRYHDEVLSKEILLCVITEDEDDEIVIVSLYKTSKIEKHLTGGIS